MSIQECYSLYRKPVKKFNYNERVNFGEEQEGLVQPLLETFFQTKLYKTVDKFATFDFYDSKQILWVEVKSLQHTKNKYKETMIGYNKVYSGQCKIKTGRRVFLVFNFSDKVCYYDLRDGIRTSWVRQFKGIDYVYIPVSSLQDVTESSSIFLPELQTK